MDVGYVYAAADGTRAALYVPPSCQTPTLLKLKRGDEVIELQRVSAVPS